MSEEEFEALLREAVMVLQQIGSQLGNRKKGARGAKRLARERRDVFQRLRMLCSSYRCSDGEAGIVQRNVWQLMGLSCFLETKDHHRGKAWLTQILGDVERKSPKGDVQRLLLRILNNAIQGIEQHGLILDP